MGKKRHIIMLSGQEQKWEFALQKGLQVQALTLTDAAQLSYREIRLPHDWAVDCPFDRDMERGMDQGFRDRWGMGWYRTRVNLAKDEQMEYTLCFDGVYEMSTVWINGHEAGGRRYGYSPFQLNITQMLVSGENEILVRVDNTHTPADRWYSGAGIYRKVYLMETAKEHLVQENIQVRTEFAEDDWATISVDAGIDQRITVLLAMRDGGEVIASATGDGGQAVITIPKEKCHLWSAQDPYLYVLTVALEQGEDEVSFPYGMRWINLDAQRGLTVNGQEVKLKGVCLHQEAGPFGTAVPKDIYRMRLKKLKEIGCNALRLAHHLFSPEMLDLCDEMGFYVYEEAFDKWTGGAYGRHYATEWQSDIEAMVKRDRNRPSVIFWGVGNEVENQAHDGMLKLLQAHVKKVKELDNTRPVTLAMNPHFFWQEAAVDMSQVKDIQKYVDEVRVGEIFDIDDRIHQIERIAQYVDVLACNYQEQWYERLHELIPDKPILGTETYMYFRGEGEKFQNYTEQNPWFDVVEHSYCIGGFIWTGIDYLGESMGWPAKGWSGALFSTDMEKRQIAWLIQSYWTDEPMVHFAVADYTIPDKGVKEHWDYPHYVSHWEFPMFHKTVLPYMIASNCEEVTLQATDKEFLLPSPRTCANHCITGYIPYLHGRVIVIGKNNGTEVCRQELEIPSLAVKLKFDSDITDDEYLLLKVRAYDEENRPVFRESAKVFFAVEGDAQILGVDNGDITGDEPYNNDSIHLYQGHASVLIRRTGNGRAKVRAYGSGLMEGEICLYDI